MAKVAVVYGLLLIVVSAISGVFKGEVEPDPEASGMAMLMRNYSYLIPGVLGLLALIPGAIAMAMPAATKHAMHAAAVVGVIGVLGGARVFPTLGKYFDGEATGLAVFSMAGLFLLSLIFVVLCVMSFIAARKARQAAEATG